MDAITDVPLPANEPVNDHAPGSPERARLTAALTALTGHPAVREAREDFLSTTSIGSAAQVVRYAFAPTVEDGFGVAYTPGEEWLEFTVSHWAGEAAAPERFPAALERAAELVDGMLKAAGEGG